LRESERPNFIQTVYKEEAQGRIPADQVNREGLQQKLTTINVVNGMIGPPSVNVDETIDIGTRQMEEFKRKLPDGFYSILMKFETMAVTGSQSRWQTARYTTQS